MPAFDPHNLTRTEATRFLKILYASGFTPNLPYTFHIVDKNAFFVSWSALGQKLYCVIPFYQVQDPPSRETPAMNPPLTTPSTTPLNYTPARVLTDAQGRLHSPNDMPALIITHDVGVETRMWFRHGMPHRDGGPSIEHADGSTEQWRDGKYAFGEDSLSRRTGLTTASMQQAAERARQDRQGLEDVLADLEAEI